MKQIIWSNKYIYNEYILLSPSYGLLLEEYDDVIYVYGITSLLKNIGWDDLKNMSKLMELRYKEHEQFKYFIDTF